MRDVDKDYLVAISNRGTVHRLAHDKSPKGLTVKDGKVASLCGRSTAHMSLIDPSYLNPFRIYECIPCYRTAE